MAAMTLLGAGRAEMKKARSVGELAGRAAMGAALLIAAMSPAIASEEDPPMVIKPYEKVRFKPIDAGRPDGPQMAVLWGDPATGPSAMFLKIPEGAGAPHVHTADYHLLVVEGTMLHWGEDQAEADASPLRPGSYWFQRGNEVHTDACLTDKCILFVTWNGPRDARVAGPTKKSAEE